MGIQPHSHLTGITAFVSAVDQGSFTAAAAHMGLSKSAVAKSVARLEERLGVQLLNRTTRHHGLTDEGRAFYATCIRILSDLEAAETTLSARRKVASGTLRVSLPSSFGPRWVLPLMVDLLKNLPQLTLDARFTDQFVDLVGEEIDLAIRIGDMADDAGLMMRKIGVQTSVICAAPTYLALHGAVTDANDLARHALIGELREGRVLPWRLRDNSGAVIKTPLKPRHLISHGEGMLSAVLAGAGLACLPYWLVSEHIKAGRLQQTGTNLNAEDRPINLIWLKSAEMLPKIRVTIDELVRCFQPIPPWEKSDGTGRYG